MDDEEKLKRAVINLLKDGPTTIKANENDYRKKRYWLQRVPKEKKQPLFYRIQCEVDELDRLIMAEFRDRSKKKRR